MCNKIGLALITCDRNDYFKRSFNTVVESLDSIDVVCVVNDGNSDVLPIINSYPSNVKEKVRVLKTKKKYSGVGQAKNIGLEYLHKNLCEYMFLMENDILIKNKEVFSKYIEAYKISGISHFNFHAHGPANKLPDKVTSNPRKIVQYGDSVKLGLFQHCVGAFSFYTKKAYDIVGGFDSFYKNAWEHVDHTLLCIENDLHPPYWYFADLLDSREYLDEIPESIQNSSITHTDEWFYNMRAGRGYFLKKHGYDPVFVPDSPIEKVISCLNTIKQNLCT